MFKTFKPFIEDALTFNGRKATVYNLLNADSALNINEERTRYGDDGIELNPDYGMVTSRQAARYVSLTARMVF